MKLKLLLQLLCRLQGIFQSNLSLYLFFLLSVVFIELFGSVCFLLSAIALLLRLPWLNLALFCRLTNAFSLYLPHSLLALSPLSIYQPSLSHNPSHLQSSAGLHIVTLEGLWNNSIYLIQSLVMLIYPTLRGILLCLCVCLLGLLCTIRLTLTHIGHWYSVNFRHRMRESVLHVFPFVAPFPHLVDTCSTCLALMSLLC